MVKTSKNILTKIFYLVSLILISVFTIYQYNSYKFNKALELSTQFPQGYWEDKYKNVPIKDKYKVVFVTSAGGEYSYSEYFKYAAEKMGWEVKIYSDNTIGYEEEIINFDPDMILFTDFTNSFVKNAHLKDYKIVSHRSRKYLARFIPLNVSKYYRNHISKWNPYKLKKESRELFNYTHGILTFDQELGYFAEIAKRNKKPFYGTGIYCNAPALENLPAEPRKLFWGGMSWDNTRNSKRYKKLINLLSENIPIRMYGHYSKFSYLKPFVYGGFIPAGMQNIELIRKNGIYLLTHSNFHIKASNPSLRLFEAATANVPIISDKHPFVIKHFGDSVLYFDHEADAQTMYNQIKKHVDWILANPEKAKKMASRAHKIFLDNFTIERDLIKIAKMHEYILMKEKEMDLDAPLTY